MTFPLSELVSLNLSIAAGGIRAPNLSTPLLVGYHAAWADYVRTFYSPSGVISSGIAANSPLHRMAVAAFAQSPSPRTIKIGRRATPPVHAGTLTPTTDAVGQTITLTVVAPDGTSRTYSQACTGGGIPAEATALAVLLNADVSGYGAAGSTALAFAGVGNDVEVDPDVGAVAGQLYWYTELQNLDWVDLTPDPGLVADLALIRGEDDDWYSAALDSTSEAEQLILAAQLDLQGKLSWIGSQDATIKNAVAGNLFLDLLATSRTRAVPLWNAHGMHEYPAVAAMAKMLAWNRPGGVSLARQKLAGVTMSRYNTDLTAAQLTNIRNARGNAYIDQAGVANVDGLAGTCSAERYVDQRMALDYLAANIPVELYNAMQAATNAGTRIPYTDGAAAVARAACRKILESAESWGAVMLRDPETGENYFNFSATPAASQTAANKAARHFAGCEFSCKILNEVASFDVAGTLSFV